MTNQIKNYLTLLAIKQKEIGISIENCKNCIAYDAKHSETTICIIPTDNILGFGINWIWGKILLPFDELEDVSDVDINVKLTEKLIDLMIYDFNGYNVIIEVPELYRERMMYNYIELLTKLDTLTDYSK